MSRNKITITLNDNLSRCAHQIERGIETILHSSKYLNLRHYEYEIISNCYSNKRPQWSYTIKVKYIDDIHEYMYLYVRLSNLMEGLIITFDSLQLLSDI